jgi:hypothetical protein
MFLTLQFRWRDSTGVLHRIDSTKDLAKAVQSSMSAPHSSHARIFLTTAALASVSVSGAANAIADQVKAGADASKTVHEVIDLSTAEKTLQMIRSKSSCVKTRSLSVQE